MLPRNAASLLALASDQGWQANAFLAVGYPTEDSEPVKSVQVRARRGGQWLEAIWERPADDSKPWSFHHAHRWPGYFGFPARCGAEECKAILRSTLEP
jgi:hypothetical protein